LASVELKKKDFIQSFADSLARTSPRARLQPRDYEIMRFILEQKFCSLEALYFRFFDARKSQDEPPPKNFWTTRQRLAKLRGLALLKTEAVPSSGKAQFLLTPFGHKVLAARIPEAARIRPAKAIDFSLFDHDAKVTTIRALAEARGKCQEWRSDKRLKAGPVPIGEGREFHFAKDLRPDAFFVNSKSERVALEIEVARKGRPRLEAKIELYDGLLEESWRSGHGPEAFQVLDKVWFIATKPSVLRLLRRAIESRSRHPLCYRADFFDDVVPESVR
jgi:hypothetical protein